MQTEINSKNLSKALEKHPFINDDFDLNVWLSSNNIVIQDGENYALFENTRDGVYEGHYLFQDARGKRAITLANKIINYFFTTFDVKVLIGKVPLQQRGARWLTRQLGFKSLGAIETIDGDCELFLLTTLDRRP